MSRQPLRVGLKRGGWPPFSARRLVLGSWEAGAVQGKEVLELSVRDECRFPAG